MDKTRTGGPWFEPATSLALVVALSTAVSCSGSEPQQPTPTSFGGTVSSSSSATTGVGDSTAQGTTSMSDSVGTTGGAGNTTGTIGATNTSTAMTSTAASTTGGATTATGGTSTSAAMTATGASTMAGATNTSGAMTVGGAGGGVSTTGATTTGGSGDDGDLLAPRPLDVTAEPGRHQHSFRASDADSEVSFNDNDQIAVFDNRAATLMGKLVLTFGGAGQTKGNLTGGGEFCASRGFHVLGVAAFQDYDIVSYGADFYGDARRTAFEGVMHTRQDAFANIEMTPADGVATRTQKALQYLHQLYPGEDWGYYLQEDGAVRWSDVIFTGMSHGASSSARFAFLVRASRVVSMAGPRDNLCERVDLNDCGGVVATWFDEVPKTPIDRFYAVTGTGDSQHTQHLFAMEKLGYIGEPTAINGAAPPYGETHRLVASAGHEDLCGQNAYQDVCNYAFGVPPENHAGTGP